MLQLFVLDDGTHASISGMIESTHQLADRLGAIIPDSEVGLALIGEDQSELITTLRVTPKVSIHLSFVLDIPRNDRNWMVRSTHSQPPLPQVSAWCPADPGH